MSALERLKELAAIIQDPKYDPWEAGISDEVCRALPKLLAVVEAARQIRQIPEDIGKIHLLWDALQKLES